VESPAHARPSSRDELAALNRELASLDETLASLVTARVGLGMTLERAGALFGLGTGSTDRRVRKALAALRESMTEEDEG
jgi:DNA-directed RNA polymerase specialized sigma24 family protein